MTKEEAYNKLMSFKKIFPSACKEIDEMYEALTSDDKNKKVVNGIKEVQRMLSECPSEGVNKAYCALNKVLVETGDYNADILSLIWTYGTYDNEIYEEYWGEKECEFINLKKLVVGREYSIDKVYILNHDNVVFVGLKNNNSAELTLSSLDSDMQIKVYEEVKRSISKTIFEPKIIEYINSLGQYDGVGYEWCLERCVTLMYDKEEVNIMRLVIEDGRLVCHALKDNDETTFIWFDCLPFEVQEEIYDF